MKTKAQEVPNYYLKLLYSKKQNVIAYRSRRMRREKMKLACKIE